MNLLRQSSRGPVALAGTLCALLGARPLLAAAPSGDATALRDACVDAHARAQEARQGGDLQTARELLRTCAQAACPQVVRADCGPWYDEVDRTIPSLVFAASSPRGDETAVRVTMDGVLLAEALSAAAMDVNPGQHAFRFELSGYPAVDQTLLVREGEKSRVLYVKFAPGEPAASAPLPAAAVVPALLPAPMPLRMSRPVPLASYVLAGSALAGIVWGSYFGTRALSARSHAEDTCRPICDQDVVHGVRDKALLADVGFGVAVLSASAAVYFYLMRPSVADQRALALDFSSDTRGQRLGLAGVF